MNRAVRDDSEGSADPGSVYAVELELACRVLSADRSDLEHLLARIHEAQVPLRQAYGLLKHSWARLNALRGSQAEVSGLFEDEPEVLRLVERAFGFLQPGGTFSLDDGHVVFERAWGICSEHGGAPELRARLRSIQAEVAAVQLRYRSAARLYEQAASVPNLDTALKWRYQLQRARALEDLGREFMDRAALEEAIGLYETVVLALAPREERPQDWAATQHHLGNALGVLGHRQLGTWLLERAIKAFENALTERSRERTPLGWAATQNGLGNALGILAQRHGDTDMLERSVEAFESALEVRKREEVPQDWAVTRNNHAAALLALGRRKKDKTILKHASDAYKDVLGVWSRERAPLDWAATMNNLGTALRMLGELRRGPRTLEQAVAAYRSALAERTRERVPQDWAVTQNDLGAALHKLGVRESDPGALESAIEAYGNALQEWTRERGPVTWAMTMANLAAARKALAELSADVDLVREALSEFQAVAGVFREASHAQYYELATEQIALLRKLEKRIRLAQLA